MSATLTSHTGNRPEVPRPPVSVCVITVEKRAVAFAKLLAHLVPALARYGTACELVVANNSGVPAHAGIAGTLARSGVPALCACRVVDSPRNNIATGRNLAVDSALHDLIAFIDDDEYPEESWLAALVDTMRTHDSEIVAGPILPEYAQGTPTWVRTIDLHNVRGLNTGDLVRFAASGNVLIDRGRVPQLRFDEAYGTSGGSDTELFMRLGDGGALMRWSSDAIVREDIPAERSTWRATARRCLAQGHNYRRILRERDEIGSELLFTLRAAAFCIISLPIGLVLAGIGHRESGTWLKRALSNLGKLRRTSSSLYG